MAGQVLLTAADRETMTFLADTPCGCAYFAPIQAAVLVGTCAVPFLLHLSGSIHRGG